MHTIIELHRNANVYEPEHFEKMFRYHQLIQKAQPSRTKIVSILTNLEDIVFIKTSFSFENGKVESNESFTKAYKIKNTDHLNLLVLVLTNAYENGYKEQLIACNDSAGN